MHSPGLAALLSNLLVLCNTSRFRALQLLCAVEMPRRRPRPASPDWAAVWAEVTPSNVHIHPLPLPAGFSLGEPDLMLQCENGFSIRCHSKVLAVTSELFNSMFEMRDVRQLHPARANGKRAREEVEVIQVQETSMQLIYLLHNCYNVSVYVLICSGELSDMTACQIPVPAQTLEDTEEVIEMLEAAIKVSVSSSIQSDTSDDLKPQWGNQRAIDNVLAELLKP